MVGEAGMKVDTIRTQGEQIIDGPVCACIGYFDGLHRDRQSVRDYFQESGHD